MDEKWHLIESAPKDGTPILAYAPDVNPTVAWWEPQKYNRKPVPYWASERGYLFGTRHDRDHQPTHWMPLPPPPGAQHG